MAQVSETCNHPHKSPGNSIEFIEDTEAILCQTESGVYQNSEYLSHWMTLILPIHKHIHLCVRTQTHTPTQPHTHTHTHTHTHFTFSISYTQISMKSTTHTTTRKHCMNK